MNTKQVVVMRKFPNLRTGKYCSQACHASMAFLTKNGKVTTDTEFEEYGSQFTPTFFESYSSDFVKHEDEINHWLNHSFRKIVCYVDSLEELEAIHKKALDAGLISHMIEDNGVTEFGGVKTKTCIAVGPAWEDKFIGITDHLKLA
jgi:PTH2 family peptidyl-tRNA hydrolase